MLIIDRFEGDKAVIEDSENEKMISLEKNMIEDTARVRGRYREGRGRYFFRRRYI